MAKVLILMGLPGSGKTTFAEKYAKKHNLDWKQEVNHIDIDSIKERGYITSTEEILKKYFKEHIKDNIIDGLFTCTKDVIHVINSLPYQRNNIEIHYWIPDKEKCLYNDTGRRRLSSKNTILNVMLEYPDIDLIKEKTKVKNLSIITHEVEKKPLWMVKTDELGLYVMDDKYLCSDSWNLGGTCCDCWGGAYSVTPEPQPASFSEFDNLLESLCPDLSFLKYKKLYHQCVDIEQGIENDYYGGSIHHAFYRCDIQKMFEMLDEWNLI